MHGAKRSDEKEVFFWGADYGDNDPDRLAGIALCGPNQWPSMLPTFRAAVEDYAAHVTRIGNQILHAVALCLGAPEHFFEPFYNRSMTRGQLICYPPTTVADDQFGVAPHSDFGCITLLLQETPGLEAQVGDRWVPVPPVDDTLVINVGDLLERWSGGRVPSTLHRVVNRNPGERFSIAMFHDPNPTAVVDPNDIAPRANTLADPSSTESARSASADATVRNAGSLPVADPLDCKPGASGESNRQSENPFPPITAADYILSRNQGAFAHYAENQPDSSATAPS